MTARLGGLLLLLCCVGAAAARESSSSGRRVSVEAINQGATGREVLNGEKVRAIQRLADSQGGSTVHRYSSEEASRRSRETMVPSRIPGLLSSLLIIKEENRATRMQHASSIVEVGGGEFVAAWFGGTWERMGDVGIWSARYENGAWGPARQIVEPKWDEGYRVHAPCWNPVLFHVPSLNSTLLFYKVGVDTKVWRGYIRRSTDGGITWGEEEPMADGLVGPAKNPPLLLPDGTILSPSSDENNEWTSHVEISRDLGYTWQRLDDLSYRSGIIQPAIFRTLDGRTRMLMRAKREDRLAATESKDGGLSYSSPTRSDIQSPNAGLSAITLTDGRVAVVHNRGGERNVLALSLSYDHGESYDLALTLEYERARFGSPPECGDSNEREYAEFSYPTIVQSAHNGALHVTYTYSYYGSGGRCVGRENIKHVVLDPCLVGDPLRAPLPSCGYDLQGATGGARGSSTEGFEPAIASEGCTPSDPGPDFKLGDGGKPWRKRYSTLGRCFERCELADGYSYIIESTRTGECYCYRRGGDGSSSSSNDTPSGEYFKWPGDEDDDDSTHVDAAELLVYDLGKC